MWIGFVNGRNMDAARPSYQASHGQKYKTPWNDTFVDELRRALMACKVYVLFPSSDRSRVQPHSQLQPIFQEHTIFDSFHERKSYPDEEMLTSHPFRFLFYPIYWVMYVVSSFPVLQLASGSHGTLLATINSRQTW